MTTQNQQNFTAKKDITLPTYAKHSNLSSTVNQNYNKLHIKITQIKETLKQES